MNVKLYEINNISLEESDVKTRLTRGINVNDRIGLCDCGSDEYIILPERSDMVKEGGKRYVICLHCGRFTHL